MDMEQWRERIRQAQEGNQKVRDELVQENLGLVGSVLRRYSIPGYDKEDLYQLGCIGLIKAIDGYDTNYDVCFSTYAVPMIAGEIRRFLRDDGPVKISRKIQEQRRQIRLCMEEWEQKRGTEPSLQDICDISGLSYEEIVLAIGASKELDSIEQAVYQSGESEITLADQVVASADGVGKIEKNPGTNPAEEDVENRMLLQQLMERLDQQERQIIYLRYQREETQSAVAKQLGVTQVQVSRWEKKILEKMRREVQKKDIE